MLGKDETEPHYRGGGWRIRAVLKRAWLLPLGMLVRNSVQLSAVYSGDTV